MLYSLAWPLVAQTSPAGTTATGKDLPAIGSGHPLTETVDLAAMTLLGLIGTDHLEHLLYSIWHAAHADSIPGGGSMPTTTPARRRMRSFWLGTQICIRHYTGRRTPLSTLFFLLFCFLGVFSPWPRLFPPPFAQVRQIFPRSLPRWGRKCGKVGRKGRFAVDKGADFCYNNVVKDQTAPPARGNREMSEKTWIMRARFGSRF